MHVIATATIFACFAYSYACTQVIKQIRHNTHSYTQHGESQRR